MTLRNYIGFSTSRSLVTPATNPTSTVNNTSKGIFNMSLEDYRYTKNAVYISASTTATSSGVAVSSIAINTPTCSEGDLLFAFLASGATNRTYTSPGWTVERSETGNSASVFSKIATGSEPVSHTFTLVGGTGDVNAIMICIKNYSQYTVGNFQASANSSIVTVPDDPSSEKLIMFFATNPGSSRSFSFKNVSEFQIQLVNATKPSVDLDAIYRISPNISLTYEIEQSGAGSDSTGIFIIVR